MLVLLLFVLCWGPTRESGWAFLVAVKRKVERKQTRLKKLLSAAFVALMALCAHAKEVGPKKVLARVTYYGGKPEKVAKPRSPKAREGDAVAAHPKYRFGTKVYIPGLAGKVGDGYFEVVDRGPAVTKMVASRGRADVFDVYVSCKSRLRRLANSLDMYMEVYVYQ